MGKKSKAKRKERKRLEREKAMQTVTQQNYYKTQGCHSGPQKVFNVGKSQIYAGSYWEVNTYDDSFDLFICANGDKGKLAPLVSLRDPSNRLPLTNEVIQKAEPTFLTMDIPDGGTPNVGAKFWSSLVKDLSGKRLNVVVYCQGGHGRTGTILACLAHYSGLVAEGGDAVQFVRSVYCPEAVETASQLRYLSILGINSKCEGSYKPLTNNWWQTQQGINAATSTALNPAPIVVPVDTSLTNANPSPTPYKTVEEYLTAHPEDRAKTTQEEIAEWEAEMIAEESGKADNGKLSGWNDYAG